MIPNPNNDINNNDDDPLPGGVSGPRRSTPAIPSQQQQQHHHSDQPEPMNILNVATTTTTTGSAPHHPASVPHPLPPPHPATTATAVVHPQSTAAAVPTAVHSHLLTLDGGGATSANNTLLERSRRSPDNEEQEPIDTADANAEAARLARELGVASSVQGTRQKEKETSRRWSLRRLNSNSSASSNPNNAASTAAAMAYYRMDESMNSNGPGGAGSVGAWSVGTAAGGSGSVATSYVPPDHVASTASNKEPIHHYDVHGQRAPYQEGAYIISRAMDGRVLKRRWCTYILYEMYTFYMLAVQHTCPVTRVSARL